jgi:hypothetical protein
MFAKHQAQMLTYLKMPVSDQSTLRSAINVGWQQLRWLAIDSSAPAVRYNE